ncbi:MAG TPA: zinc-ribbon domain-containing protein [bacterium]|nr:zinc-ribbon domain-containing protein [bacterium]
MRCPRCGVDNPEGKIVCRACGARLRAAAASGAAAPRETEGELRRRVAYDLTRILWVAGVVIAVGLGLGFLVK